MCTCLDIFLLLLLIYHRWWFFFFRFWLPLLITIPSVKREAMITMQRVLVLLYSIIVDHDTCTGNGGGLPTNTASGDHSDLFKQDKCVDLLCICCYNFRVYLATISTKTWYRTQLSWTYTFLCQLLRSVLSTSSDVHTSWIIITILSAQVCAYHARIMFTTLRYRLSCSEALCFIDQSNEAIAALWGKTCLSLQDNCPRLLFLWTGWQLWLILPLPSYRDACVFFLFLSHLMFSWGMGGSGSSIRLSCNSLISSSWKRTRKKCVI